MPDVICLLSGGMDSTTLLAWLVENDKSVECISVNYGQRHARELLAADLVAEHYGARLDVIDLGVLREHLGGSALTSDTVPVPDGHYAEDSMRATVVPNRNAIMLSVAAGVAVARRASLVMTAVHAGDHFIYPDCRPDFITSMSVTTKLATKGFGDVQIRAPFVLMSKADICRTGNELGAPLHLSWSCYRGDAIHCGSCGTCVERREAFTLAGVPDPTSYQAAPAYTAPEGA